jgi:AcrR family transcriptional regulator
MKYNVTFNINERLYIKDPESTETGRQILKNAIHLICSLGFEQFNFKKLALEIETTEATIYRYFENKHKLLLYIFNWYWNYLVFLLEIKLQNIEKDKKKIDILIDVLTTEFDSDDSAQFNKKQISQIVVNEHSKAYLIKNVDEINKDEVFKPYKNLCSIVADIIKQVSPSYHYPKSLSRAGSMLVAIKFVFHNLVVYHSLYIYP